MHTCTNPDHNFGPSDPFRSIFFSYGIASFSITRSCMRGWRQQPPGAKQLWRVTTWLSVRCDGWKDEWRTYSNIVRIPTCTNPDHNFGPSDPFPSIFFSTASLPSHSHGPACVAYVNSPRGPNSCGESQPCGVCGAMDGSWKGGCDAPIRLSCLNLRGRFGIRVVTKGPSSITLEAAAPFMPKVSLADKHRNFWGSSIAHSRHHHTLAGRFPIRQWCYIHAHTHSAGFRA
jgi:hypothetical protein